MKMMQKMLSKFHRMLILLSFLYIKAFSQTIDNKSWHYLSLSIQPQYILKSNDRILIFPLNYEYLPKFFNHHYSIGTSINFNDVKLNHQKEFSVGIRNTFYVLKNPKFRPYLGFGIHSGNLKILNEWYWQKYKAVKWQARIFVGTRIKVSNKYMVFAEYGNYRIGSPKFNFGLGLTRILNH